MIREIGVELQAALRAKLCPVRVVDREQTNPAAFGRERIVIEHDEGDSFVAPRGSRANPKHRFTRTMGAKVTIYAQSTGAGALEFEHRRRAEHILDLVLVALDDIARKRKNAWTPTGGGFVIPEALEDSERHGGAVYELRFTFDRAVFEQTWAGDIKPEATVGEGGVGIGSTTRASIIGANDNETACGA
jgi:hypothetical protein